MSLSLDYLPRYSPWPARLLGLEPFQQKTKTPAEITREFGVEKWGAMLRNAQQEAVCPTIEMVEDRLLQGQREMLCSVGDQLELLDPADARKQYIDLVVSAVADYLPAPAIVELGCGYGSVLLSLARRFVNRGTRFIGGEFTTSGVELCGLLASSSGIDVTVGHCDFNASPMTQLEIPPGSVFFTSFATMYVADYEPALHAMLALRPSAVIHFEPCFDHFDPETMLGLLRRKYMIANDYNKNIISILEESENCGDIRITQQTPNAFGSNPLLPASVVCWVPASKTP
jgi:hypothetical protein